MMLGPGCSSLGFGAFMEHGPFQPGDNGLLVKNEYSWNLGKLNFIYLTVQLGFFFFEGKMFAKQTPQQNNILTESNMLYVESPIGVGFSYSNTSSDYVIWNDTQTGMDFTTSIYTYSTVLF